MKPTSQYLNRAPNLKVCTCVHIQMKRAQASLFWLMLQYESLLLQLCTALFSKRAQSKCPTPTACGYVNGSSVSGDEECMNVIFWSEACKCILLGKSVCVCVWGGETGRGLFLGGMWRINKCVRIKKKKMTKKKANTEGRHDSAIFLLPALSSFCSSAAMATTHRLHRLCYISTAAK